MIRFGAAVFLSAALLFMVQPMAARRALPVLGGTPAVWTASLLFFQAALLAGYAYAHLLTSRLALRAQIAAHAVTLLAPLAALAWLPVPGPPAPGAPPVPWLLAQLATTVGLPFFALSTTASLLQRWFSLGDPRDPYPLYAASNLGSLAGLFAYPLVLEPCFALDRQRALWAAGYALFVGLAAACAVRAWRTSAPTSPAPRERTGWADRLRWIALAAAPTSLLMGVTQHLSTDLAPFPLLWVLPLALYLLSYVVAFSSRPAISPGAALLLQSFALIPLALLMPWEITLSRLVLPLILPLHLAGFFLLSLVCHGDLAARRPPAAGLTEFYLCLAVGGAAGGAFNALAAPLLFQIPVEYPLVMTVACLLRPRTDAGPVAAWRVFGFPLACLSIGGLAFLLKWMGDADPTLHVLVAAGATVALMPLLHGLRFGLGAGVAALLLAGAAATHRSDEILHRDRSFFGAHHVERTVKGVRSLVNGRIRHGSQDEDPAWRTIPLTYYHRQGPCGLLFEAFASHVPNGRVGAVGLGAGTVAAYGLPGQRWTFFEVDPAIERTAREYFTYLADSRAAVDVVVSDGRVGLERAAPGEFGLILLDAFSSDAVPVHLLTREALELYFTRLAPGGVLALHVTNRYMDLVALLGGHAAREGWAGLLAEEGDEVEELGRDSSTWVLLARDARHLRPFLVYDEWKVLPKDPAAARWTDAHSSILPYIKLR
ncbi:MAG TPA: fused MFS/spermidine synthase [Planctomycetota bacterium]